MAYDAVIIGAGHNGLAAAVRLADRGKRVAVVEAKDEPGGAVKTRELTLPGFRHDLCAMNLSMFAGSPFFRRAQGRACWRTALPSRRRSIAFATVFRDGTYLGVSRTLETTLAGIAAASPADAEAWRRSVQRFGADAPHIFALLGSPMPSVRGGEGRVEGVAGQGRRLALRHAEAARWRRPRDFLDAHFEHPKVKAMMAAWGLHLDFAPDVAGGALFPYLECMANQSLRHGDRPGRRRHDRQGDGRRARRRRAASYARRRGRQGSTSSNGAASGVTLQSGRKLEAGTVIANVHPKIVFGRAGAARCGADRYPSARADISAPARAR